MEVLEKITHYIWKWVNQSRSFSNATLYGASHTFQLLLEDNEVTRTRGFVNKGSGEPRLQQLALTSVQARDEVLQGNKRWKYHNLVEGFW